MSTDPLLINKIADANWVKQYRDNAWLGLGDTSIIKTGNPFSLRTKEEIENPHIFLLDLMRKPENFFFTCQQLFGITLIPFQLCILRELWIRPFPMLIGSRGMGKSYILAVYCILRAIFCQGSKIVICGGAFRQAKIVFDYCAGIWDKSPVLRSMFPGGKNGPRYDVDRCIIRIGESTIIALPLGDGTKIRGQRANIIIAEEFASIPVSIFETVVRGFASVNLEPVSIIKDQAGIEAMKELGLWTQEQEDAEADNNSTNQTIISGTAYYAFNWFYDYWRRYRAIIESKGDPHKLDQIFKGKTPDKFNWRDFSVIRIPVEALPKGLMNEKQIGQAKATVNTGIYQMEYGAVFPVDSDGFYRRSLVEGCVVGRPDKPVIHESCGEVLFHAVLRGAPDRKYVMAIDPATGGTTEAARDNFSITILELHPDHRRIVYCWTTTRTRFNVKASKAMTEEKDFYGYCARKIRSLMRLFNCVRIALDSQGGGIMVIEVLSDPKRLKDGEKVLLPAIVEGEPRPTDDMPGDHIIDIINFSKAEWVRDANQGMRKDFEDKVLLFPEFDSAIIGLAIEEDKMTGRVKIDHAQQSIEKLYDTLEDCVLEIEEMKDELATIVHTQTGQSLRDRWDTPETKIAGGKKGRLRKDRYSSLLMANMVARQLQNAPKDAEYRMMGGFVNQIGAGLAGKEASNGQMYIAPDWWTQKAPQSGSYGARVHRIR